MVVLIGFLSKADFRFHNFVYECCRNLQGLCSICMVVRVFCWCFLGSFGNARRLWDKQRGNCGLV